MYMYINAAIVELRIYCFAHVSWSVQRKASSQW